MATKQPPQYYLDFLDSFPNGVDSNIPSRSLAPTQISLGTNLSLRGQFARTRPPFVFINIIDPDGVISGLSGLFQGACYYRPDSAPESMFLVVSGRLFQLTPDNFGNALLKEWTIPGDPNDPDVQQAWLWQAELFVIVNDGIHLPLIFDGATVRRSIGNAISTLAITAAPYTTPATGSNVTLTIVSPYTGPLNAPVTIDGESFTTISANGSAASLFTITCEQTNRAAGGASVTGDFRSPNAFYAFLNMPHTGAIGWALYGRPWPPPPNAVPLDPSFIKNVVLTRPYTGALYSVLYLNATIIPGVPPLPDIRAQVKVGVATISPDGLTIGITNLTGFRVASFNPIDTVQGSQTLTWSTVFTSSANFTIPGQSVNVDVPTAVLYTGAIGQYVYFQNGNSQVEFQVLSSQQSTTTTFFLTVQYNGALVGVIHAPPLPVLYQNHELPAGRMGTYGLGRVWESLPDGISFIGSDVVGSSSGTLAYNFRDAVLKVTQNVTLAGGINFRIPDSADTIRALQFTNTLDVSLGQGPLLVFTDRNVFSCQAPIDVTTWASLTNPILTVFLKGSGGKSQNAVVLTNADIIFRSDSVNIRSALLARMDYNQWGNTPISTEMIRFLKFDDPTLLYFSSGIQFDNRMIMTCFPRSVAQGVMHRGFVVINFDSISGLQGKAPSLWEGLWTGLQTLQLLAGSFSGVDRAFALVQDDACAQVQLYEILKEQTSQIYDVSDFGPARITQAFESADLFRGAKGELIREFKALEDGEIDVDNVLGIVTFQAYYRADQSPNWYLWRQWDLHIDETLVNSNPGYFPRQGLGKPDEQMFNDGLSDRNSRFGYTFQFRLVITGHCRFLGARFKASPQAQPEFQTPSPT